MFVSEDTMQEKMKAVKYERLGLVPPKKRGLHQPANSITTLKQKTEKSVQKLNIQFQPSNGWR
jgi:hypothetical protein